MSLSAGRLQHRVQLQSFLPTRGPDTLEELGSWSTFATVWAHIEPVSVRDFQQSAADQVEISARVTLRYRADFTPQMRIVHRGKFYNPAGLLPDKVSGLEYVTLPCSEGVNDGR